MQSWDERVSGLPGPIGRFTARLLQLADVYGIKHIYTMRTRKTTLELCTQTAHYS